LQQNNFRLKNCRIKLIRCRKIEAFGSGFFLSLVKNLRVYSKAIFENSDNGDQAKSRFIKSA